MKYLLYLLTFHLIGPQLTCPSKPLPKSQFVHFRVFVCPFLIMSFSRFAFFLFCPLVLQQFCPFFLLSICPFILLSFCPFVLWSCILLKREQLSVHCQVCKICCTSFRVRSLVSSIQCAQYCVQYCVCTIYCLEISVHDLVCTYQYNTPNFSSFFNFVTFPASEGCRP